MDGQGYQVAVVGATGAVGTELLKILEERRFPIRELVPFSSARSLGKTVSLRGRSFTCRTLEPGCFNGVEMAFFDASDSVSKQWVPEAARAGAWVVDNSAFFRMDQDIPLVVPEVNGALVQRLLVAKESRIIAGPNCSTVQMVAALKPIHDRWGLKRVVVSTYQATSGAGAAAREELAFQTGESLAGKPPSPKVFAHPIAFNCIPQIGGFKDDGYTSEERKLMEETRKILDLPLLRITATAIRVPTLGSHAESVNIELEKNFTVEEVRAVLGRQAGVVLQDNPSEAFYPMNHTASGRDAVYVGRIRRDTSVENGLNLWIVSDNLRKGAALNAVQIGELIHETLEKNLG